MCRAGICLMRAGPLTRRVCTMIACISGLVTRSLRRCALTWRGCSWYQLIRYSLTVLNCCLLGSLMCLCVSLTLSIVSVYTPSAFVLYSIVALCSVVLFGAFSPVESLYKKRFFR